MKSNKGFTLIELMIVVAIIGILSAIAIPKFADLIRKSNEGATKGNLGALRSALSIYYGEQEGKYPIDLANHPMSETLTMENGKYIKEIPSCFCPPYHDKTTDVVSKASANENTDGGAWGYQDNDSPAATDKPWGDLFVNCTHTDSKAGTWSEY